MQILYALTLVKFMEHSNVSVCRENGGDIEMYSIHLILANDAFKNL